MTSLNALALMFSDCNQTFSTMLVFWECLILIFIGKSLVIGQLIPKDQVRTETHSPDADTGTAFIHDGLDFIAAFINPTVGTLVLASPMITIDNTLIKGLLTIYRIQPPVLLNRNMTIRGDSRLPQMPTLNMLSLTSMFRLGGGVTMYLTNVAVAGTRGDSPVQVPGLDLLGAPDQGSTSYLTVENTAMVTQVCFNADRVADDLIKLRVPPWRVGKNTFTLPLSQDGCANNASLPLNRRCWGLTGRMDDFVSYTVDDLTTTALSDNMILTFRNVSMYCETVVTEECAKQYGSAYYCLLGLLAAAANKTGEQQQQQQTASGPIGSSGNVPSESPTPTGAPAPSGSAANTAVTGQEASGSSDRSNTVLIAGLVGGIGGAAVIVLAVVLAVRMRRRRAMLKRPSTAGSSVMEQHVTTVNPLAKISGNPGTMTSTGTATTTTATMMSANSTQDTIETSRETPESYKTLSCGSKPTDTFVTTRGSFQEASLNEIQKRPIAGTALAASMPSPGPPNAAVTAAKATPGDLLTPNVPQHPDLNLRIQLVGDAETDGDVGAAKAGQGHGQEDPSAGATFDALATAAGGEGDGDGEHRVQLLPAVRGKGSFGRVVEGLYRGQRVAVKIMSEFHEGVITSEALVKSFQYEVEVLGRCRHPNVVRLLAACVQPPRQCLVMELMEASLDKVLYGHNPLGLKSLMPLPKVLHIGIEVCRALAYLHPTVVHRDLKPGNVLINDPWSDQPVVKLTDFGLSRLRCTLVPTESPDAGTPAYMAPECFDVQNKIVSHKADIFAFGVLLWEMLAAKRPWEGMGQVAVAVAVSYHKRRLPLSDIPSDRLSSKLERLLEQSWDEDPERRPAADEVGKELAVALEQEQLCA